MKYLGLRKYIVNACTYIDFLFSIALFACFIQWCFGYEVEAYKFPLLAFFCGLTESVGGSGYM